MKKLILSLGLILATIFGMSQDGGKALSLSDSDYLLIPSNPDFNLYKSVTIEMWMKTPGSLSNQDFQFILGRGTGNNSYSLGLKGDQLRLSISGDNSAVFYLHETPTGALKPNRWHHIAISNSQNGGVVKMYVNGDLVTENNPGNFASSSTSEPIFVYGVSGGLQLDQLRFWSSIRTLNRVNKWMHAGSTTYDSFVGSTLVFQFEMNEGSGTTLASTLGQFAQSNTQATLTGSPSWVNSDAPTIGTGSDMDQYLSSFAELGAIWSGNSQVRNGIMTFQAQNTVGPDDWVIFGSDPSTFLVPDGVCGGYEARFDYSIRLQRHGNEVPLREAKADLSTAIDRSEYERVGLLYGNTEDDFSGQANCALAMSAFGFGTTYETIFPLTSQYYQGNYLSLAFDLPAPLFTACNDPRGGIQIEVDWTAACQGGNLDNSVFASMNALGFHSGGTADVSEAWGTGVDWNNPAAVQAQKRDADHFVAYLPDVNAYYGLSEVNRVNFLFNQGAERSDAWAASLKDRATDGSCTDFFLLLSDVTETCAQTTTGIAPAASGPALTLAPNPMNDRATLSWANPEQRSYTVNLYDLTGKQVRTYPDLRGEALTMLRGELPAGLYLLTLRDAQGRASRLNVTLP
jgi:hypothetical protein